MTSHFHILISTAVLIASCAAAATSQPNVYKKFAGEYVTGHEFGGGSISLKSDGTFSEGGGSDDGTGISTKGTFRLVDGKLRFHIDESVLRRGEEQVNLLSADDLLKKLNSTR